MSPENAALTVATQKVDLGHAHESNKRPQRDPGVVIRQIIAGRALTDLIAHDLPLGSWNISPFTKPLDIHLSSGTDDEMRADIAEWADFFGVEVRVETQDDFLVHTVQVEHMGASVKVWCHTDHSDAYRKNYQVW